jgi:predicted HAD superfamily Cof-like phosphohydrolase
VRLVREFHIAFGIPVKDGPTIPYRDRVQLRRRLIQEEFEEVMKEFDRIEHRLERGLYTSVKPVLDDVARLAKELSDLRIVCEGTELEFGIPGDEVYAEVHRSNMSKLGPDGTPVRRHDGKVLKGPNYEEANVLIAMGVVEGVAHSD